MGSIYKASTVTIAVHSAKDPWEGVLWRRLVSNVLLISPESPKRKFWLEIPSLCDHAIHEGLESGQISNRAWIVQELCLSRRTVHFVQDRILWEYFDTANDGKHPLQIANIFRDRSTDKWLEFVEEYSSRGLTRATDRLAAIAGLAQAWNRNEVSTPPNQYFSGIFTNDVHNSLLWYCKGLGRGRLSRNPECLPAIAPSWSWANPNCDIGFVGTSTCAELAMCMEVASFHCDCNEIMNRHLVCTGCSMHLRAVAMYGIDSMTMERSKMYSSYPEDAPKWTVSLSYQAQRVGWAIFDGPINRDDKLCYLQISLASVKNTYKGVFVLVVRPSSRKKTDYIRVGIAFIFKPENIPCSPRETFVIV